MKKFELGNKSESVVLSAYLAAGFTVSLPFGSGAIYDLIVDSGIGLYKIQVKTAWISKSVVKYKCVRRQPGKTTHTTYKEGKVDYFAVYCPTNNMLYGISAKNQLGQGWLRLTPTKNNQSKSIKWASDYSWERHIDELKGECARQDLNLRPSTSEADTLSTELRARKTNYRINKIGAQ